jgi:hypothetical protein
MSGKIGNFPWWKSISTLSPIPVVDSPQVDLSDVPDSVPPEANWSHNLTVKNISGTPINLSAATITEGAAPPRVLPVTQTLHQNDAASFGPVPHPGGITADLRVAISVDFSWQNGPVSSVTAIKTIRLSADLAIEFQTPPSLQVSTAWSYSLTLRNVGRSPLAIGSLKQRLSSADFATTAFTEIPLATPIHLNQGASATVAPVTGIPVPRPTVSSPTHKVAVEIQPTYSRGGETRTWEPQTKSEEIDYIQGDPLQ